VARRTDTRTRLLDAAAAVVRRDGANALTLDAVAAEAGVSKGGLLYHFKTKRDLLDAMLEGWLEEFAAEIAAADEGRGFAHAYVKASDISTWAAAERATEFGLLAAMVDEPGTLERVRARYAAWQDGLVALAADPVDATVARLAADGLWLNDLLGLAPPAGELRERVMERMLRLAAGARAPEPRRDGAEPTGTED
jgi:AcrR family transcriptional regulator